MRYICEIFKLRLSLEYLINNTKKRGDMSSPLTQSQFNSVSCMSIIYRHSKSRQTEVTVIEIGDSTSMGVLTTSLM